MSVNLTELDWWLIEREACQRRLSEYIKQAWPIIEPGQPFVHGWHIDAIAEHLEAVTSGEIKRLLINIPPGMMKSLSVGVFWPTWEWGPKNLPHLRYVAASHAQHLATRDNLKARRLVMNSWFQDRWPLGLAEDQNAKLKFENEYTGFREAAASASMTGSRGDRVIIDDPHSVEGALSDAQRETTLRWFTETVPTRLNNPDQSAIIVIMQRLHERDVAGYILEEELGYEHLCLPMEYEADARKTRRCVKEHGCNCVDKDPRTEEGELLFPERFPRKVVEADKKTMGSAATAGQMQQSPTPRGGGSIKADKLEIALPGKIISSVRYWDKAGTEGGGKYTAGVHIGKDEDGVIWILDVVRGQWSALRRERNIKQTAILDGKNVPIWVEQEPGSGGKESAENTVRGLAGWIIKVDRVTGDKVIRAEPFAAQVEGGNVKLKRGPWNRAFIEECRSFPVGRYKDQVDAAAGGFNKLSAVGQVNIRVLGE